MALAVRAAMTSQKKKLIVNLVLTILFAMTFMVIKYFEYTHKFHEGQLPGSHYSYAGLADPNAGIFFGLYFTATGLHGIHVLVGIGVILWILKRAMKGEFHSEYFTPVELTGLYWHLVDLIWIFLFPLFYLVS
jgi:cytochrome c oxidase subunit 3